MRSFILGNNEYLASSDVIVSSVPMPNHLTLQLTFALSSPRFMSRCWTGELALLHLLYRMKRSVSCMSPNHVDLQLTVFNY